MYKKFKIQDLKAAKFSLFPFYCLLFTAYCLLSSCATTENVDLLRQDVTQLRRDFTTLKGELNSIKVKASGAASEDSFNVVRQSQAEIQAQLSNVSRDMQLLNGRFDENKYFMEKSLKNSSAEMDLIKVQITSLESQIKYIKDKLNALEIQIAQKEPEQPKESEKKIEEPEKELQQKEEQPVKPAATDKAAKYSEAYNAFTGKKYKEARKKFEAFVKEYPKDRLADNAQFWVAETYYGEKDFEGAILAYEMFLKKYPKSEKAPTALLKQGLSFIEMGDKKTGKVILEQVRERYPNSKEAGIAKKNIEDLKKSPRKKK